MTETDQIDLKQVSLVAGPEMQGLFGRGDEYARLVEDGLRVRFVVRDGKLIISGSEASVALAEQLVGELVSLVRQGREVGSQEVRLALRHFSQKTEDTFRDVQAELINVSPKKRSVRPKGARQAQYIQAVRENDIVIGIGPAGTGKTYLAVAFAVASLKNNEITKIVLTRPAVEAGESLGFLPGDLKEKVDPYLRPLYDALDDMIPAEKLRGYIEKRVIEIAPLAYMRGRTIHNAFVILDEAQNASAMQMKMFLTRLGPNSRAIVTGDVTQIDLPAKQSSGLVQIQDVLRGVGGISFVYFDRNDVVRHRLVKDIIDAYEKYQNGGPQLSEEAGKSS